MELDENKMDDLDTESSNDDHVNEPEQPKPEVMESSESFHFQDGKGRVVTLSSAVYPVNNLAAIAAEFLGMDFRVPNKSQPTYTQ